MNSRGPKPTPLRVLTKRGSRRGKDREKEGVVNPRPARPNAPKGLPKGAHKYWAHAVGILMDMELLAKADRNALARYCTNLWFYERTRDFVNAHLDEPVVNAQGVEVERPQVKRLLSFDTALRRAEEEFGFTPSARSKLLRAGIGTPKKGESETQTDEERFFGS